jgi:predicted ATPase
LEEQFARIHYLGPLREPPSRLYNWSGGEPADMGRRGENVIAAILSKGKNKYISPGPHKKRQTLEERIANWLQELGLIHSFSVSRIAKDANIYEVKVKRTPYSAEVLITDVGFGISQILPVIAICYYVEEGSTILLEQPEIHLHPSVQMGLADVFIDAIKNRNIQIILESHSEHLLSRLQRRMAEGVITQDELSIYFCEQLNLDPAGNISNWPKDFFGDRFGETVAQRKAALQRQTGRAV